MISTLRKAIGQNSLDQSDFEPAGHIGVLRVWTAEAVPLAISALKRIASNRGGY